MTMIKNLTCGEFKKLRKEFQDEVLHLIGGTAPTTESDSDSFVEVHAGWWIYAQLLDRIYDSGLDRQAFRDAQKGKTDMIKDLPGLQALVIPNDQYAAFVSYMKLKAQENVKAFGVPDSTPIQVGVITDSEGNETPQMWTPATRLVGSMEPFEIAGVHIFSQSRVESIQVEMGELVNS